MDIQQQRELWLEIFLKATKYEIIRSSVMYYNTTDIIPYKLSVSTSLIMYDIGFVNLANLDGDDTKVAVVNTKSASLYSDELDTLIAEIEKAKIVCENHNKGVYHEMFNDVIDNI